MLQIDNLHATVAGKPILKGLSHSANAGEVHASTCCPRHPALDAGSRFSSSRVEGSGIPAFAGMTGKWVGNKGA